MSTPPNAASADQPVTAAPTDQPVSAEATDQSVPVPPAKRTAAEIQADLERTRAELSRTVDELADRVDPRAHVNAAKERVAELASDGTEQLKEAGAQAKDAATHFVSDVRSGEPRALAVAGAAVAAVAGLVAILIRRR